MVLANPRLARTSCRRRRLPTCATLSQAVKALQNAALVLWALVFGVCPGLGPKMALCFDDRLGLALADPWALLARGI